MAIHAIPYRHALLVYPLQNQNEPQPAKHHDRAEHWVLVKGTAEVTKGGETLRITEDQSTHIPHEIIQVQACIYLGEDDILRIANTSGRA